MRDNPNKALRTKAELLEENELLRARLDEAEQTLNAIRSGDVDALVVAGPQGDQVFSLTGAERTYRLIVETMNEAALTVDLDGTILFCNQRFSNLLKCPLSEAVGRKLTTFVAPAQETPLQQLLANAQERPVQRSLTLRASDGVAVSVQVAASLLVEAGNTSICLVASDLTELEEQADSIRVMRERQQALEESRAELQASNDALCQSRLAALNVSEDAVTARRQAEELASQLLREIGERQRAEEQIKASLAEKEVMLREIHHRVKNNLQVISSLINLQAAGLADERLRDEFNDVRDRVRSMALIHEKLYQTNDLARLNFADYAVSLLGSLWRSHGNLAEKARLNLEIAPVVLTIQAAVPCGLILNELASNALKHAFPNGCDGEVTVSMKHDPAADSVCLRVHDNGVGLPASMDWRQSSSLGLHLVRILAGQLHATVETGIGPGAEFQITFPLNEAQS